MLGKALGWLGKPVDLAYRAVPESVKEKISESLYGVLLQVRNASRDTVRRQPLYDAISQATGVDASDPAHLARLPLGPLDRAAQRVLNAHSQLAVVQGGVTGAAGLPGLVADVPSLYFLLFRCVEEIACCYGFPADSEEERDHLLKVVDVGHFLESGNKRKGMRDLETFDELLRRGASVKDLERTMLAKGLQTLSRQLSTRLVQRKLAQTVAVVGAVIGAGVNAALVNDVGSTAFHAYRLRRLRAVALRRAGHSAAAPASEGAATFDLSPPENGGHQESAVATELQTAVHHEATRNQGGEQPEATEPGAELDPDPSAAAADDEQPTPPSTA